MIKSLSAPVGHVKKTCQLILIATTVFAAAFINCQSPVDKPDPASDLIEFESVWQYLKAYSIHQDAVAADPFAFAHPALLMDAIHDTLKGNPYTHYFKELPAGASATVFNASTATGRTSTVFLDSLTPSTACITITGFESSTWTDFKSCAINAGYPNIIIDIRHNLGGQLDVLDSIISSMVPAGTKYIQDSSREYDKKTKSYITTNYHPLITQEEKLMPWFNGKAKKYVVIMDSLTASASEILAAAMYEGDTTTKLIGTRSYGKGMGQIILDRRTRQPLQITFLYIKGVSDRIGDYHRVGIKPDPVDSSIIKAADAGWDEWKKEIFYALKLLEPKTTASSFSYASHPKKAVARVGSSGLYTVIKEEDILK